MLESNTQLRIPDDFDEYHGEEIMSNFDYTIISETENAIKGQKLFSRYSAMNFNGIVWWENDLWHCEVWRFKSYQQTFSSESLKGIMNDVSSEYGFD